MIGDHYKGVLVCSSVYVTSHGSQFLKGLGVLVESRIVICAIISLKQQEAILFDHAILITCYRVTIMVVVLLISLLPIPDEPLPPSATLLSISDMWRLVYEPLALNLLLGPQAVTLVWSLYHLD